MITTNPLRSHTHSEGDVTNLTTDLANKVPTSRTVNSKALSSNITLNVDDVGDGATLKRVPYNALGQIKNKVMMFNGTTWQGADAGSTFTFYCNTFTVNQGSPQLIGTGVWKAPGSMVWQASYTNGPPTTAMVRLSNNGAAFADVNSMTGPAYTSGTNSGNINYPSAGRNAYLSFQLYSASGSDVDTDAGGIITFQNNIYYGLANKNTGFSAAEIAAIAGKEVTTSFTNQRGPFTMSAGQYWVIAYPSAYADLHVNGVLYNGIVCPFVQTTVNNVTNANNYTENYKVVASANPYLPGSSVYLSLSTSSQLVNPLYYGTTTKTSGYNEADVENLTYKPITNDHTQIWNAVNTGYGEYLLFAFPTRLGIPTFWIGGFEGTYFQSPETVTVVNANGYSESYNVWRSINSNLGSTVLETR